MTKKSFAVLLVLVALAGCTSELAGHGVPARDVGGPPSASATIDPAAMAQAKAQYQELVDPTNKAAYAANLALQAYDTNPDPAKFQLLTRAEQNLADTEQRFVLGLAAARWPDQLQPAVDALVAALRQEVADVQRLARATNPTEYAAAQIAERKTNQAASAKASALRTLLGLGDVPDISPPTP